MAAKATPRRRDYRALQEINLAELVERVLERELTDEDMATLAKVDVFRSLGEVNARHAEHAQKLGAKLITVEAEGVVNVVVVPTRMWAEHPFNARPGTEIEDAA